MNARICLMTSRVAGAVVHDVEGMRPRGVIDDTAGVLSDAVRPGGEYTSIVDSASAGSVYATSRRTLTASMPGRS